MARAKMDCDLRRNSRRRGLSAHAHRRPAAIAAAGLRLTSTEKRGLRSTLKTVISVCAVQ